jgi:hypothetical protein
MFGNAELGTATLEAVRAVVVREESVTLVRVVVFLLALAGGAAWARSRTLLAWFLFALAGFAALSYWLVQIATPLGLHSDRVATRDWAQAGASAALRETQSGFVWGTPAESSLATFLAGSGVPLQAVHVLPQAVTFVVFSLLLLLPYVAFRNRRTATFAACLLGGGGIWPGSALYDRVLERPTGFFGGGLLVVAMALAIAGRFRLVARLLRRFRLAAIGVAIAASAVCDAPWLAILATAVLVAPLRGLIRKRSSSKTEATRVEAYILVLAFGGSGLLWWNPPRTVATFAVSTDPGAALMEPLNWIRNHLNAGDVVLASRQYSGSLAAMAGRRVLFFPPLENGAEAAEPEPLRRNRLYDSAREGRPIARLAEHFQATHLFLGPGEANPPDPSEPDFGPEQTLALTLVYEDVNDFRIFRLTKK